MKGVWPEYLKRLILGSFPLNYLFSKELFIKRLSEYLRYRYKYSETLFIHKEEAKNNSSWWNSSKEIKNFFIFNKSNFYGIFIHLK